MSATVTLTKDELSELLTDAAANGAIKAIRHFQSVLSHKEETIKTTKAYTAMEVAKIFGKDRSTIYKWYELKECRLKRNRKGLFLGTSVKEEYERINGK